MYIGVLIPGLVSVLGSTHQRLKMAVNYKKDSGLGIFSSAEKALTFLSI